MAEEKVTPDGKPILKQNIGTITVIVSGSLDVKSASPAVKVERRE